jgi:hypothetical protein
MARVPTYLRHVQGQSTSLIQIVRPERIERVFTEMGKRVTRKGVGSEMSALQSEITKVKKALQEDERCLQCGQIFKPEINFRYRACRMHTGTMCFENFIPVYSCCGRSERSPGCVSCMHVARSEMYQYMKQNPMTAFVEVSKILVDSGHFPISKQILVGYPYTRTFVAEKRRKQLEEEKMPGDELREEDWVYRINMLAILPAPVSLYFD